MGKGSEQTCLQRHTNDQVHGKMLNILGRSGKAGENCSKATSRPQGQRPRPQGRGHQSHWQGVAWMWEPGALGGPRSYMELPVTPQLPSQVATGGPHPRHHTHGSPGHQSSGQPKSTSGQMKKWCPHTTDALSSHGGTLPLAHDTE